MGKLYKLIKSVRKGGFGLSEMTITDRIPDKIIKVSDNEVCAVYGNYKQTWTAEGSGNERYNFKETITEVNVNDSS